MIYETIAEAEAASNAMYLEMKPEGTTEMLYGWIAVEGGYELVGVKDQ